MNEEELSKLYNSYNSVIHEIVEIIKNNHFSFSMVEELLKDLETEVKNIPLG